MLTAAICIPLSSLVLAALIGSTVVQFATTNEASAMGDRARAYQREMNGGPGCLAGDCSHSRQLQNYYKKQRRLQRSVIGI
jgi:hypothetical protein